MPEETSNLPVEQQNPFGLNPENYDEDIEAIDKELKDLDDLYATSKTELDRIRASRARGSLSFTHMQTANLISMKSQKLSLIKARQAIKKERFKQAVQMKMLTGGDDGEIPVYKVLEVLSMNGMNYEKVQRDMPTKNKAEEVQFEEAIEAELADDDKQVTTAENELNEFAAKPYEPPKAQDEEPERGVETEEFNPKTEVYEVVCDPTGKIYIIDLENSTVENTELFDPDLLGITPDEKAIVTSSKDGLLTAKFRNKDIEVVQFDEGGSK